MSEKEKEKETKNNNQGLIIAGSIIGTILLVVFSAYLFFNYRNKKKDLINSREYKHREVMNKMIMPKKDF